MKTVFESEAFKQYPPPRLSWTIWGCGAALYLLGFFQRVAPAVMTAELTQDFGLTGAGLGNLSAFYFYSYVAMQIPTGILADKLGPRKLLASGALLAAIGSLVFATASESFVAGLGRLLVGGSVAVAFVGMLKLASHWFSSRQFALATGLALFCGVIGAVFAGVPLRHLVSALGWREVMIGVAVLTFVVCLIIWMLVRDDPSERGYLSHSTAHSGDADSTGVWQGIKQVLRYRNTWLLTLAPGGIVGCVLTFSGLWGIPFLTTHYSMSPTNAAALTSTLLVTWAIGGPILGAASDRLGRRKIIYAVSNFVALFCWIAIVFIPGLPQWLLVGLLVVAGIASGGMIIGFAFAKESVPANLAGTVSGIINMGVMVGPMLLQPVVGIVLDSRWAGVSVEGVRVYDLAAYRAGFSLMVAWAALASILLLMTRDTRCRQQT